ncbi:unnamed protein product [Rotaria sp. Silwood2]|nr:unnamed protein product [Rotaria sp. Silwood2]CAF2483561.1 unnamed protein product [Rotaria sp. Silwood2]CAF2715812.1 unnamed protein product [Rotaria sp. Silwood2]CAF2867450.1 unnamed protein product [Rotaria sp. Silwood2]CAF4313307.1 unnamed protein product [Rotaria sp. Silwood2]
MKLLWYSAGNIIYALGSLGYLAINTVNLINRNTVDSPATYIVLIILAIVFVIDALLYTIDWFEQRTTKTRLELIACILNVIGSILYLIGATVFQNNKTSTNESTNLSDIPAFVFNILGMLAYLAESILDFFIPRVSKQTSKCSVEFFAHLLNLVGNITYLIAHIIQPIISFIASFTTAYLNKTTDIIYIIIRPIQMGGDIIYIIDAILYIIVWMKANEHIRRIGTTWVERANTKISEIAKKNKQNVTKSEQLPESIVDNNNQIESKNQTIEIISNQIPEPVIEQVEPSIENPLEVETIT